MTTDARSRVRRWGLALLVLVLLLGGSVAGLPWMVRLPAVHWRLAAYANSVLAPGSVEFSPMRLSWFRPTEVPDVTLRDAEGDAVLVAPKLTFEWGLWQLLVTRPRMAHVDLTSAKLDIERRPDGTIDLHETLKPIVPEHPKCQILIHLENSHVRLRDRLLGEPFLADDLDARIDMSRGDEPISWKLSMAPEEALGQSGRLEIEGSYSRAHIDGAGQHDTNVTIRGRAWPFAVANARLGVKCRGVLDGSVDAQLQSGLWMAKGETKSNRFELSAPGLAETIRLDAVSAGWDVKGTESGWMVDRLALESSLGSLRAEGSVPAVSTRGAWIEANLNLADLAPHLSAVVRPRDGLGAVRGVARLRADLRAGADGSTQNCDVLGTVSNLVAPQVPRVLTTGEPADVSGEPAANGDIVLGAHATYDPHSDRLDLTELAVKLPYVQVKGAGAIRSLTGNSQLDLKGTLNPDWRALTAILAEEVEPNARIAGQPRPWRVSGSIASSRSNDALETLSGELGIQIDELDVFGVRLGHSALVVMAENGRIRIDPIDATLNQGVLHLEPELARDQNGHRWLRMGKSSSLEGAVINDEVSHRVLSYAAPILDGATRVQGRISARLREAVFPIMAPADAQARILGDVTFDDVRFMPGRLADQLLVVFDKLDQPLLILRDSISIEIEDRKVHQKGLVLPVANLASIALDGSVDFDKNLDLVAGFTLNRSAPVAGVLPPLLQNARVDIPIRGTMQNPTIDTGGFKDRLADMGMDFVGKTVGAGLNGLQRLLGGKAVEGLGDYFLPRARPMAPAPQPKPENVNPKSKRFRKPETPPAEPEPPPGGAGKKNGRDG
jgi:hypothetical protein